MEYTEYSKSQNKRKIVQKGYTRIQSTPITRTFATDSNLMLTQSNTNLCLSSGHRLYNFTLNNSNHVLSACMTSKKNRLTVMIRFSAQGPVSRKSR